MSGYDYANTFANWVSRNQFRVAKMRVNDSLSSLCERKFRIQVTDKTLELWYTMSSPMLHDLLQVEESSADIFDDFLPLRKKEIIEKYLGAEIADKYEDRFSLYHDPYQIIERMYIFLM